LCVLSENSEHAFATIFYILQSTIFSFSGGIVFSWSMEVVWWTFSLW